MLKNERFSRLENLVNLDTLSKQSVMIVGLGGVGSFALEAIARSAIGEIIIIDFDIIEESNINRQLLATSKTIGKYKVDVAKERIYDINPHCHVIAIKKYLNEENISSILEKYQIDYCLDCIDSLKSKAVLIEELLKKNIKFISAMGTANKMHPELFEITTLEKTEYDSIARVLRKKLRDKNIALKNVPVVYSKEYLKNNNLCTNSFCASTCGLLLASYVINDIKLKG